jgi:tetratricopeptide (TPR) repeat protein
LAHALAGISLHFVGELGAARSELETALQHGIASHPARTSYLGFDGRTLAGIVLARTLWMQGHQPEGLELLHTTVDDAERRNHPVTLAITLIYAISVLIPAGDLDGAEQHLRRFLAHARHHALAPYLAVGLGFTGRLALLRGDARTAVESLQSCLTQFRAARYALLATPFNAALAEGLAALHRHNEAEALIDETIATTETNGDLLYMPELLRAKAGILLSGAKANAENAEECLRQSLEWSRRQGALSWELRAAIDCAGLLAAQGRREDARSLLLEVKAKFSQEPDNADLVTAQALLAGLG